MYKQGVSVTLLLHLFFVVESADERRMLPTLKQLAVQQATQNLMSSERGRCFMQNHQDFENIDLDMKSLIVDQLLKPYESEIYAHCSTKCSAESPVHVVRWHPEGAYLASGHANGAVGIWDMRTGQMIGMLTDHLGYVSSLDWHPSGLLLASGSEDGTVCIWDVQSRRVIRRLEGYQEAISSVHWHPNSLCLATGSLDRTVCIWDIGTGDLIKQFDYVNGDVLSVCWYPNGEALALGCADGSAGIWNASEDQLVTLEDHQDWVSSVAWHPEVKLLASGSFDSTAGIWDVHLRHKVKRLQGHQDGVVSVDWHKSGRLLASGSLDRTVGIWDTRLGSMIKRLQGHQDNVASVQWHPSGDPYVVSGSFDGTVCLWNTEAYNTMVDTLSIVQALYFAYRMEHGAPCYESKADGKQEDVIMDGDPQKFEDGIENKQEISREQIQVDVLEASLPDALKRMLHKNHEYE